MNNIKVGSWVKMNDTYEVDKDNVDRIFKVVSKPFDVCGTQCVMLKNHSGAYALDGLTLVSNTNFDGVQSSGKDTFIKALKSTYGK